MQKYLLLLLMCLVGIIETQAGIKVDNVGSGSYVLTFTNGTTESDWSKLSDIKSATSVKIVTDGYKLSATDMMKITGEYQTAIPFFPNLKTLDFEKAELNSYDDLQYIAFDNLKQLETFSFPEKTNTIPLLYGHKGMFQDNNHIKTVLMFENPAKNDLSSFTVIPAYTFQNATNLTTVRIPEGVEEIGASAFAGASAGKAPKIASIHFPNTLKRIDFDAFGYNSELTSVIIPANVNYIGDNAFKENKKLEDVYVLGNQVETFDGSFNQEYTYDGFTFNDGYDGNTNVVSINDWKSNKSYVKHPARLHFPNDPEAYKYCVNPFLRALNDLSVEELRNLNTTATKKKLNSYGIKTSDMGKLNMFNPSNWVEMEGHRYFKDDNGMFNQNCELLDPNVVPQGSTNYTPFNGWHNFMFAAGDLEEKIWHDGRLIESRWYSAVFPFDMSYNQVMSTFGAKTDVREFSYVNEHMNENGQTVRTVSFYDYPEIPDGDKNKSGWVKTGVPYMIHPGVRSVPVTTTTKSGSSTQTYRIIAGVNVEKANKEAKEGTPKTVTRNLIDGEKLNTKKGSKGSDLPIIEGTTYTFTGTYTLKDIPANSFYLGYEPPRWPLAFYVTTVVQPNKWNPYTSIVQKQTTSGDSNAKTMDLGFENIIEDDFGIATEVVNFVVQQNMQDNKVVYNLNGQAVRKNNTSLEGLSKGVYVVNGKKIVVR